MPRGQHPWGVLIAVLLPLAAAAKPPSRLDSVTPFVATAGQKVLEQAQLSGLKVPFDRVAVGTGAEPRTWYIQLEPKRPSIFRLGDACRPQPGPLEPTLCHVTESRTVCSMEGIETLLAISTGDQPKVCGGAFRPGASTPRYSSLEGPPASLIFVLAHELGHIALGHETVATSLGLSASGDASARMQALRKTITENGASLKNEKAADAFASTITSALIERSAQKNAPDARDWVRAAHTNTLRATFLCVDEATRCLWVDEISLPPSDEFLKQHARKLACAVVSAKEGSALPAVRGTHGDWAMRMGAVDSLVQQLSPSATGSGPGSNLMELVAATDDMFRFWERESEPFYKALAVTLGNLTVDFDPSTCGGKKRKRSQ